MFGQSQGHPQKQL
jgi:regulator of sirC expression with transglutaminase-like and TPR domain